MSQTVDLSTSYFQDFHLMNKLPAKTQVSLTINVNVGFWMPSSDKIDNAKIKFSISFKDATNDPILFDLSAIMEFNVYFNEQLNQEDARQTIDECLPKAYEIVNQDFQKVATALRLESLQLPTDFLQNKQNI